MALNERSSLPLRSGVRSFGGRRKRLFIGAACAAASIAGSRRASAIPPRKL